MIVALWGEHYCSVFLDLSLPSLLSENNLPSWKGSKSRLVIVTQPEDEQAISDHPSVKLARQSIEVLILKVGIETEQDKYKARYSIQPYMIRTGMERALQDHHAIAVIAGDLIFGDGYCKKLAECLADGYKLVLGMGLRASLESTAQILDSSKRDGVLTIPNREVVRLGIEHIHPINQASTWDAQYFSRMPYTMLWPVFGQGVSVRCFGMHACLIDGGPEIMGHVGNVDHDMARFFSKGETYYVTDSDELTWCEVALLTHFWPIFTKFPASADVVARWASEVCCTPQWEHVNQRIRFHTDTIDWPRWEKVDQRVDRIIEAIQEAAGR